MFANPPTKHAIDARQEDSLTIYELTNTVQLDGQLDNAKAKDPFKL